MLASVIADVARIFAEYHHPMADKPNYGIDAPGPLRNLAVASVLGLGIGFWLVHTHNVALRPFVPALFGTGSGCGFAALMMLWSSLSGKFHARDSLFRSIPLRGDERVLDVGCGHGLMLIGAAKRLTSGRAVGVDLWQNEDQADNSAAATRRNAELESVLERVEIRDGDARKLPFEDASFDAIVSSLVIHNIYDEAGRTQALDEMIRVLRPGGRIGIMDIRHGRAYARHLASRGLVIERKTASPLFMLTRTIVASKPDATITDR